MKKVTVTIYADDNSPIVCKCNLYPGRSGRWYMPNGDPGYPDEPAECEVESAIHMGRLVDLTGEQLEEVEIAAWEAAAGDDEDERAYYAEASLEHRMLHGDET